MSNFNVKKYYESYLSNKSNNKPNNSNLAPQHEKNYAEIRRLRNAILPFTTDYEKHGNKTEKLQEKINQYLPLMGQLRQKVNTYRQKYAPTRVWQQGVRQQRKTRKNRNGKNKI
jgi:hypothetical protein